MPVNHLFSRAPGSYECAARPTTTPPLTLLACAGRHIQRSAVLGQGKAETSPNPAPHLPHAPALDGLRALAVCAVLLYHAGLCWIPGGFLGVEVFFVISGYLITSLLLAERSATGRIDLVGFWLRRARRLLPALFAMLLGVVAFAVVFLPDEVAGLRGDAVSGALYVNNWYQIFSHASYFENVGRPSLLRHLWSLAVEEQFYLVWPVLFCLLMRWKQLHAKPAGHDGEESGSKETDGCLDARLSHADKQLLSFGPLRATSVSFVSSPFHILLIGAAASAIWMALQYVPDADPSRIYFGTDTRASGILIGAALAFLRIDAMVGRGSWTRRSDRTATEPQRLARAPARIRWTRNVTGLVALIVLAICLLRLSEFQAFLYCGGFVLTSLATAALIATVVHAPETRIGRIFAWTPLRWIGVRSYGIYLWHFPIFLITRPQLDVPMQGVALLTLRLTITILIAALSYRYLELPIRQGAIARYWHTWRMAHEHQRRWLGACGAAAVSAVAALLIVFGTLLFAAKAPPPAEYLTAMQESNHTAHVTGRAEPPPASTAARAAPAPYPTATSDECAITDVAAVSSISGASITAIGDSVMLGVRDELQRVLGTNVIVDAEIGRQARHALAAAQKLRQEGKIRPIVILHIGANGSISAKMFDKIMAELADAREVVIVNVKVPRPWETPNNEMLAEAVRRYPKTVLVDWHAASENRPEIFWKDGHHLRPQGAAIYAELIAQALRSENKPATVAAAM